MIPARVSKMYISHIGEDSSCSSYSPPTHPYPTNLFFAFVVLFWLKVVCCYLGWQIWEKTSNSFWTILGHVQYQRNRSILWSYFIFLLNLIFPFSKFLWKGTVQIVFFHIYIQGEELKKLIGAVTYIECSSKTQQVFYYYLLI